LQTITVETVIHAPATRCFDAARDIDLHVRSLASTGEQAVAGRMSGLIEMGEEVTWRGRHFGIVQHFTSKITAFDRPAYFQDAMQRGAFKSFVHDHRFFSEGSGTRMVDVLTFAAPLGFLGGLMEHVILRRYLARLLQERAVVIKRAAESTIFAA
jgi:ligand-binding SRPBCC domain-containing protein